MLEGEPSAQSEVLSPVEQVFIEDISVLCSIQLPSTLASFIQSDLQCILVIHFYCQYVYSLGIEPTTLALQTQCSTTEPQEHPAGDKQS